MRGAIAVLVLALAAGCAASPDGASAGHGGNASAAPLVAPSQSNQAPVAAAPFVERSDASLGALAASQPSPPVTLSIASIGIDMTIQPVGLAADNSMEIPTSASVVGWYEHGAAPANDTGNTVLAAHVDDAQMGLGPFSKLKKLGEGDEVWVADASGQLHGYTVRAVEQTSKTTVDSGLLFARDGNPQLVLVTCGGKWNESTRHYEDNVIVWAEPMEVST